MWLLLLQEDLFLDTAFIIKELWYDTQKCVFTFLQHIRHIKCAKEKCPFYTGHLNTIFLSSTYVPREQVKKLMCSISTALSLKWHWKEKALWFHESKSATTFQCQLQTFRNDTPSKESSDACMTTLWVINVVCATIRALASHKPVNKRFKSEKYSFNHKSQHSPRNSKNHCSDNLS